MEFKNVEASFFVVQSPSVNAELLVNEINEFLFRASGNLLENFAENKASLLAELREPIWSMHEQSEKFWQSILMNDYEFNRQQELINAVAKITPDSLRKYYEAAFLPKRRRLWLSTEKLDNMKDFDLIQNVADYQQKQQGYLYP